MLTNWLRRRRPLHPARNQQLHEQQPLIELRHVVKRYETPAGSFTALKGVSLQVGYRELVAVVGKSGSGKSTLLNILTGIDRPTSGQIQVADAQVHAMSEEQLARWRGRTIGVVFQFFQLIPVLSALENVMLPMDFCGVHRPQLRPDRAKDLLELVGLAGHTDKVPSELSGGQQQRVAIARALANDPPILVADEPTGNLDSRTADEIFGLFERLVEDGKTLILVTHDSDLASRAPRTVRLADGEIVDDTASLQVGMRGRSAPGGRR